jgi:hypothetical protein
VRILYKIFKPRALKTLDKIKEANSHFGYYEKQTHAKSTIRQIEFLKRRGLIESTTQGEPPYSRLLLPTSKGNAIARTRHQSSVLNAKRSDIQEKITIGIVTTVASGIILAAAGVLYAHTLKTWGDNSQPTAARNS